MLRVDPHSEEPPFAQLRSQLTEQITAGTLQEGERLPTVRRLAGDLGIAPNTVARAYRELEGDGLIVGRGRAGTFVTGPGGGHQPTAADREAAAEAALAYAKTVRSLRISTGEALVIVREALRA